MLTADQLDNMKKELKTRESELMEQLKDHFGMKYEFSQEVSGELSNYDNHPGDLGTELFDRSKDLALNDHAEKELEEINGALHAIEEGSYGICSVCGEDIPYERLQAVPTTARCVEHAEKEGFSRERPVEEEVMSPNITHPERREREQAGFDEEDAYQEVSKYGSSDSPSDFYEDKSDYNEMYPNSNTRGEDYQGVEDFVTADQEGNYDEETLNYYRNKDSK